MNTQLIISVRMVSDPARVLIAGTCAAVAEEFFPGQFSVTELYRAVNIVLAREANGGMKTDPIALSLDQVRRGIANAAQYGHRVYRIGAGWYGTRRASR